MLSYISSFITPSKTPSGPSAQPLALESGQLYLNSKLLFKNSSIHLLPAKNSFIVQQVLHEQDYHDEDEEGDDELLFLITQEMAFYHSEGGFVWLDLQNNDNRYKWIPDTDEMPQNIQTFQNTVYKIMHRQSNNQQPDLETYIREITASLAHFYSYTDSTTSKKVVKETTPAIPSKSPNYAPVNPRDMDGDPITRVQGELYIFDNAFQHFSLQKSICNIEIYKTDQDPSDNGGFWIIVEAENKVYLAQPISVDMNGVFRNCDQAFYWVYVDEHGKSVCSFSCRFEGHDGYVEFARDFGKSMYEIGNRTSFTKVKKEDQQYLLDAYIDDIEMTEAADALSSDSEESDSEAEEPDQPNQELDDDDEYSRSQLSEEKSAKNSQLAVGYKHDRSFVVRGSKIGVFRHGEENTLKHSSTINAIKDMDGTIFSPRKIMLHEQDSSMLLMNPKNHHSIYKMDLEYGKVVEEWKVDDIMSVDEILPDSKTSTEKTLIGINHNSIFRIDPRLAGNKRVDAESKQYVTKNKFSCGVTTGQGGLAVGSEKGEVRLFNKLNTRAKTVLPGLGDAIHGIDTTHDGKYIVATCKTYLLLLNTEHEDHDTIGFNKPIPTTQRKPPKKLSLKPEHVAMLMQDHPLSFTTARFNNGGVGEESGIVTSSGSYVITWNFKKVKQGRLYDYQIKKYADSVVADNFKFGGDERIIVTLPENVEMIGKSNLTTPRKFLKSRSSFVNSPY